MHSLGSNRCRSCKRINAGTSRHRRQEIRDRRYPRRTVNRSRSKTFIGLNTVKKNKSGRVAWPPLFIERGQAPLPDLFYYTFTNLFYRHLLHLNLIHGPIIPTRLTRRDRIHHILSLNHFAKDRVARRQRIIDVHDEELRSIRVWTSISHRQRARFIPALVNRRSRIDLVIEAPAPR